MLDPGQESIGMLQAMSIRGDAEQLLCVSCLSMGPLPGEQGLVSSWSLAAPCGGLCRG